MQGARNRRGTELGLPFRFFPRTFVAAINVLSFFRKADSAITTQLLSERRMRRSTPELRIGNDHSATMPKESSTTPQSSNSIIC